jgi:hydrogenase maturation factor
MMVITTKDKDSLLKALSEKGIESSFIGTIVEDKNRRVLISNKLEENIEPPQIDELFNINIK